MSETVKVVPIRRGRRADPEAERLREQVRALEEQLRRLEGEDRAADREGLLVALARLFEDGLRSVNWDTVARAWAAFYFTWHSQEVDDFGFDRKFTETMRPIFEFLYTVWWRVEATGLEHVPAAGAGLIVANHSGVLPYDGLMINVAVRHDLRRAVRAYEKSHIENVLKETEGDRTRTAEMLGMSRSSLYRKIEQLGIT